MRITNKEILEQLEAHRNATGETIQEFSVRIDSLEASRLRDESIHGRVQDIAEKTVLKEMLAQSKDLSRQINTHLKNALLVAGAVLAVMAAAGYFGLNKLVTTWIDGEIGHTVKSKLDTIQAEAEQKLADISLAHQAAKASSLIAIQTDYGSKSGYMGGLLGIIHSANPHARIAILSRNITAIRRSSAIIAVGIERTRCKGCRSGLRPTFRLRNNEGLGASHSRGSARRRSARPTLTIVFSPTGESEV